ncbi:enolase C-terminal domain-like protein [Mesorhizobium sp. BH1-1-4]|uniref:enolase C-terminal domain-like protein n=1 Tax=Mesorhizobium sp. BH1-1-4 TaxID=2876662 RepID=UPI001CD0C04E|nr:enolase C-terminal domain-like protein [Mesorhizobium sp. BH1-1-4]MBZ9994019.1 hypothetical protein [Mesorhizobium sp. BH1-1-4]
MLNHELARPLVIESAELRLIELPLLKPFTISSGTMTTSVAPIVVLRGNGCEGYAEGVADVLPDYLPETIVSSTMMMRDVLLPAVVGKHIANPQEIERLFRPWRDHQMAKATVEMAFWDLWAKVLGLPLWQVLGGTRSQIEVGASLGIREISETMEEVALHVQQGYRRIKLKINTGHDLELLDAVRTRFPHIHLTVDANCCYTLSDLPLLRKLDSYGLDYIEQPLAWNDLHDHVRLQSFLPRAKPRSARSAALFVRQIRPSPRKAVKLSQRFSM